MPGSNISKVVRPLNEMTIQRPMCITENVTTIAENITPKRKMESPYDWRKAPFAPKRHGYTSRPLNDTAALRNLAF